MGALVRISASEKEAYALKLAKTHLYGGSQQTVLAKILAGEELGIGAVASQTLFHEVSGKLVFSANGLATLLKRSEKYDYEVISRNRKAVHLRFHEEGREPKDFTYTYEDAVAAGHVDGRNHETWAKYTANMLFARAISDMVRTYCPDITLGIVAYVPEEFGGVEVEPGKVIVDAEVVEKEQRETDSVTKAQVGELEAKAASVGSDIEAIKKFTGVADLHYLSLKAWRKVMKLLNAKPTKEPENGEVSSSNVQGEGHQVGIDAARGQESPGLQPDLPASGDS